MFDRAAPLFARDFMLLKVISTGWLVAMIVLHTTQDQVHTWTIAAVLSIAMNSTYIWAAYRSDYALKIESFVAAFLIGLTVAGLWVSPWLIIAGIFGHGAWDLAKHVGHGVPFFRWYTLGCVTADWSYGVALTAHLVLS